MSCAFNQNAKILSRINSLSYVFCQIRTASGFFRRIKKQEELNKVVFQYAGKNLKRSSQLYCWGYAATGALGVRTFLRPDKKQRKKQLQSSPFKMDFFKDFKMKVKDVAAGCGFTLYSCLLADKRHVLYGTGVNSSSQIGYHEYPKRSGRILDYLIEPVPIEIPCKYFEDLRIMHIACGRAHSVVVTNEGIYTLGNNCCGQCARPIVQDEVFQHSQIINKVDFTLPIQKVICGLDHTLILTQAGEVYSCGLGADGQTGLGHFENIDQLTKLKGDIEGEKITELSCRADCVLAVSEKGDLFGWGNNEYNQLSSAHPDSTQVAVPTNLPLRNTLGAVKKCATSAAMCAAVNESGHVYVWGYGLLGKGPNLQTSSQPLQLPQILFGENDFQNQVAVNDIQCGLHFLAAMTDKQDLYMWGLNRFGSLGLGHAKNQYFPFKVHLPAEVHKLACGADHCVAMCLSIV